MILTRTSRFAFLVALLAVVGCSKTSDKSGPGDAPAKVANKDQRPPAANPSDSTIPMGTPTSQQPTKTRRPAAEQKAIDEIRKLYGKVQYANDDPAAPVVGVSFKSQRRVKGTDLAILASLTSIQELNLDGTSVTDVSLLAPLTKLKVLYLPDLSPDHFDTLAKLPSLESLSVGIAKPSLSTAGIDNPYKNREATKAFESQDFLSQGLERLCKSPSLKHLRLTQGGSATIGGHRPRANSFAPLSRLSTLVFLEIQPLFEADEVFTDLSKCSSLQTLIVGNISHKGMSNLSGSKSLKHLQLTNIVKDSDAIVRAASAIPTLERFNYSVGRVSDSLLIELKRDNPRLVVEQKKRDLWNELVVGNQ